MSPDCVVIVAAALKSFWEVTRTLVLDGCGMQWIDTMGAYMYNRRNRIKLWRVVPDWEVLVQAKSAVWDVTVTW